MKSLPHGWHLSHFFPGTRSSARLHPISHILTPSGACSHDACEAWWRCSASRLSVSMFGDFYWLYQWSIFCITYILPHQCLESQLQLLQKVCCVLWVYVYTFVRLCSSVAKSAAMWCMAHGSMWCGVSPRTLRSQWSHRSHGGSWWIEWQSIWVHLRPHCSVLFLAFSGSLAESGEPLWTRPHTAVIRLSLGVRGMTVGSAVAWLLHDSSTARKIQLIGPPRKCIKLHQDAYLRVSSLSKRTFANHIEPYWTVLNHIEPCSFWSFWIFLRVVWPGWNPSDALGLTALSYWVWAEFGAWKRA